MRTVDKVYKMFYKAAAAKNLNTKIMQKRAEIANRPSDAYLAGFCKTAEDMGVDPVELMKIAGLWDDIKGGFKNIGNGIVNGAKALGKGVLGAGGAIGGAMNGLYGSIGKGIGGLVTGKGFSGFKGIGNNIASGFTNGASNAINAGRMMANTAVGGVKNMFGLGGGAQVAGGAGAQAAGGAGGLINGAAAATRGAAGAAKMMQRGPAGGPAGGVAPAPAPAPAAPAPAPVPAPGPRMG